MKKYSIIAFFISFTSLLGSLYFSEIKKFFPCELCWYQRILMYPLVVLFFISVVLKKKDVFVYTLPLTILGMIISFYHYSIQKSLFFETKNSCTIGSACNVEYINWFGFVTIPLLAFFAFTFLTFVGFLAKKTKK